MPITAARDHCLSPARAVGRPTGGGRYGRMFPGLDPLGADPHRLMRAGSTGGLCDVGLGDVGGVTDSDDAAEAAGWPFFGQLIAHDITADRSPITGGVDPETLRNARRPKLNLELLYSDGPVGSPYLFDLADPDKFLLMSGGHDVPRNPQGVALIGDPRNDVHLFSLSLHIALQKAHNRLVDRLRAERAKNVFDAARTALTWHYQWIVVHDFLPRLVGPVFPDLVGFGPLPDDRRLDLAQIFDVPGRPPAQRAKRLDGRLAASLIGLPEQVTGAVDAAAYRSLAVRDLLRGDTTGLPSGETVARAMGEEPLTPEELDKQWPHGTPLWYYLLKEAEHRAGGDRLGPVGGRIVAEVLIGLLRADRAGYLSVAPDWEPVLPAAGPRFGLTDLLIPAA